MANVERIVRDYTLRANTQGVDEVIRKTERLGSVTDEAAVKTENFSKSSIGTAAALERQRRQIEMNLRTTQQFEAAQRDLNMAMQRQTAANDNYVDSLQAVARTVGITVAAGTAAVAAATAATAAGRAWLAVTVDVAVGAALMKLAMIGSFALIGSTVSNFVQAMRRELMEMKEVAEGATRVDVSPEFFQAFIAGAKGATDQIKALEAALGHAFQASKPVLNPDWTVWDVGRAKIGAVEKALTDLRELFTTDQKFGWLDLFRGAKDTGDRSRAVLQGMQELFAIGQKLAALDLGEKMFGSAFVDKLRTGQIDFNTFHRTVERLVKEGAATNEMFSNETVRRVAELDERLKTANFTIQQSLKPSFEDLDKIALNIKATWVGIVEKIAEAVARTPRNAAEAEQRRRGSIEGQQNVDSPQFVNPQTLRYRGRIYQARGYPGGATYPEEYQAFEYKPPPVPYPPIVPPRKPEEIKAVTAEFDRLVRSMERSAAVSEAEAKAVDGSVGDHARLRAEMRLQEAAMQDIAKHGGDMEDYAERIKKLADRFGAAAQKAAELRLASDVKFTGDTVFFSDTERQIASVLRQVHGSEWKNMMDSPIAGAMRFNEALKQINTLAGDFASGLAKDFAHGVEPMEGLGSAATRLNDNLMAASAIEKTPVTAANDNIPDDRKRVKAS